MNANPINPALKKIILTHEKEIDDSNFAPVITAAMNEEILEELIEVFASAGIPIPPTVVYECLYKKYVASSAKLSPQEKEKLKNKTCALINKQQALLFKAMFD